MSIIYEFHWFLHVILIKFSSRVGSWFALETLVHLGILSNFFNKLLHQLIKCFKVNFKFHHLMHIWSPMSPKSQANCKLASWLMVVDQRNSSDQNWGPLNRISYNFIIWKWFQEKRYSKWHSKQLSCWGLELVFFGKSFFMVKDYRSFCLNPNLEVNFPRP